MKKLPTPNRGVYSVVKERGKRANMIRVGQAMSNSDGSIMVYLDAWPLSGTLLIRDLPATDSVTTPAVRALLRRSQSGRSGE